MKKAVGTRKTNIAVVVAAAKRRGLHEWESTGSGNTPRGEIMEEMIKQIQPERVSEVTMAGARRFSFGAVGHTGRESVSEDGRWTVLSEQDWGTLLSNAKYRRYYRGQKVPRAAAATFVSPSTAEGPPPNRDAPRTHAGDRERRRP